MEEISVESLCMDMYLLKEHSVQMDKLSNSYSLEDPLFIYYMSLFDFTVDLVCNKYGAEYSEIFYKFIYDFDFGRVEDPVVEVELKGSVELVELKSVKDFADYFFLYVYIK